MKTIHLTSPPTTGPDVTRVQMALNGHNAFKTDWFPGKVDGVFGAVTAAACVHAKRDIGYPASELKPIAGDQLLAYLREVKPKRRTPAMIARAALRRRQRLDDAWRAKMIAIAKREVGVKEHPPDSNSGPRVAQYQKVTGAFFAAWCASFQSWVLRQAGYKGHLPDQPAWCPGWHMTATAHKYGFRIVSEQDAGPGDWVIYNWQRGTPNDDGVDDHIGMLLTKVHNGAFKAVEGNTAVGNDSNGGQVMIRDREMRPVSCFVRKAWA